MKTPVPSRAALIVAAFLVALGAVAAYWQALLPAWQLAFGVFGLALLADLLSARAVRPNLELERFVPRSLPIGRWRECIVRLHNRAPFAARCEVVTFDHEHVPGHLIAALEAEGLNIQPGSKALGVEKKGAKRSWMS